jgi:hypothetical protein
LQNFVANQWRHDQAQKRGGAARIVRIDADTETRYLQQLSDDIPPEALFDREWAKAVSARVFRRLREEYKRRGKEKVFEGLQGCFPGVPAKLAHAEAANPLSMTDKAARQAIFRMRKRYRELLRMEIAASGTSEAEIDEEIRYLRAVLGGE